MKKIINNKFKFSVLISVYDKEKPNSLRNALDSILINQTLKPDEIILIVDGKVNRGLEIIIGEYELKYNSILKVYRLEKNRGLGEALNFGLDKCSFNLVARADSDDINYPERFELQVKRFMENSKLDVLGTNIDEFDNDPDNPVSYKKMPLSHKEILKMSKIRNPINHMSVMFKKDTIVRAGEYQHLPYLEDYYLWVRVLSNNGHFENIDKNLVHVQVGNGMVNRRSNKEYIPSWKILNHYMIKNKMINIVEYLRNIIFIYGFIYMPLFLKKVIYKLLLRN